MRERNLPKYVIITAAKNEARNIESTLQSVVNQTVLPAKWVIVDDDSMDRTRDIVTKYTERFDFIDTIMASNKEINGFCSKVHAVQDGVERIKDVAYDFIGIVDADISFEKTYFKRLFQEFETEPRLGVAGGYIYEKQNGEFQVRLGNSTESVAGAVQMFRRECYQSIGGYHPFRYGGEDWHAEEMARIKGWKVQSFPELKVLHHKPTGSAFGNTLKRNFYFGRRAYSIGSHPLYETIKCLRTVFLPPYLLAAACRLTGYFYSMVRKQEVSVSQDFISSLRSKQLRKLFQYVPDRMIRSDEGRHDGRRNQ